MEGDNGQRCSEVIGEVVNNTAAGAENHNSDRKCCKASEVLNCDVKVVQKSKEKSEKDTDCADEKQINCKATQEEKDESISGAEKCQSSCENGTESPNPSKIDVCTPQNVAIDLDNSKSAETCKEKPSVSNLFQTLSIKDNDTEKKIDFYPYKNEEQLPDLIALITKDLSEPYSIYTYRYFLHNWPHLSHLAYCGSECVGAIVCKLDVHRKSVLRGYIAMLVVHKSYRRYKIGSTLVRKAIMKMIDHGCEEVVLETEVTNKAALQLYENLGFVRDKRLLRYYLNGVDAWRLKLWLK